VVPVDHPCATGPRPLPLVALADLDLVLPLPNTALRDEIDNVLRRAGVTLRPAMELDGIRLIASLTFDGYGPAILPATAVPQHMRERFDLVALEGFPRRRVGVSHRRRGLPSAPTRAVMEILNAITNDTAGRPAGLHPPTPGA
jgi:DNA-binding transcriptional LysR family regulator